MVLKVSPSSREWNSVHTSRLAVRVAQTFIQKRFSQGSSVDAVLTGAMRPTASAQFPEPLTQRSSTQWHQLAVHDFSKRLGWMLDAAPLLPGYPARN